MPNAKLFPLSLLFLSLSLHRALSDTPSPSVHAPNPAPASSPVGSPSASPASSQWDFSHADDDDRAENSSRGGLSWIKKAGLGIGVIVATSVTVLAVMVYRRKVMQNIRRSQQYQYAVRREFL